MKISKNDTIKEQLREFHQVQWIKGGKTKNLKRYDRNDDRKQNKVKSW